MTLAQRMKLGTLSKVQDLSKREAKVQPSAPKKVLIGVKKSPAKPTMKQYGDKGYKPSTGKGVGY